MKNINKLWLGALILIDTLLITVCLIPIPPQAPTPFTRTDLVVHFSSYFILTALAAQARFKPSLYFSFFFLQGCLIEVIQPYFNRSFEWLDILCNSAGVCVAFLGIYLLKKLRSPAA